MLESWKIIRKAKKDYELFNDQQFKVCGVAL
jgi:hypothetical protein